MNGNVFELLGRVNYVNIKYVESGKAITRVLISIKRYKSEEYDTFPITFFGDMAEAIYNTSAYFKYNYEREWITEPKIMEMIKDIDKSVVLGNGAIDSPVLGVIAPTSLSGGVKTLMLINNDSDHIFNASACGDNCAKWILNISKTKDITIRLGYLMDFGNEPFDAEIVNTGEVVHNLAELNKAVLKDGLI